MYFWGDQVVKVVVVGQDQDRLKNIRSELKVLRDHYNSFQLSSTHISLLEMELDPNLTLLIFDTNLVNDIVFPLINKIRRFGFTGPVLMLSHLPKNFDLGKLATVKNFFMLQKPYDQLQLLGMAKNCINVHNMRQRRDQRFDVLEQATLEAYSSDFKTETVINNISRSGVRIEGNLRGLKKGDILRLHFNFQKIRKERMMSARVVWVKKDGDIKEEAGLEFVSQKAVYQYLLNNAAA